MSWEAVALGNLCEVLDNKRKPITKRDRLAGEIPYYGATGIVDYVNSYIFDEKLVLIGEDGAKWGSGDKTAFIVNGKCWVNNHAHVIKPYRNLLLDEWLVYYFYSKDLNEFVTGLTVPKLNQGQLRLIQIPLPTLVIQQKLVTKLDAIFAEIDKATAAAEANIKNAEALFQSYLTEVFERGGDEWSTTNLQSVVKEVITGPFGSSLHKSDYVENGVPVINPQNIINGKIIPLNKTMVSIETKERLKKFALQKKDIVIARRGEMGRCGLVDTDSEGWLCGTGSMIIRLNDKANENYIFQLLQSNRIKQQLESASIGATMNNLNQSILLGVEIALPPIEFQVKILNTIEQLSKKYFDISQIYFKKIKHLTALKQSILQQAFNGELIKE